MAISSNNIQVYTTLSKELVAEIDKDAKANYRTPVSYTHLTVKNSSTEHRVSFASIL